MKRSCPNEEKLGDYLEHRLGAKEKARVEAHLSECDQCLEDIVVTRGLVTNEARIELESAPDSLIQKAAALSNSKSKETVSPGSVAGSYRNFFFHPLTYASPPEGGEGGVRGLTGKLEQSLKRLPQKLRGLFDPARWEQWRLAPIRSSRENVSRNLIRVRKVFRGLEAEIEIEKTGENRAKIRITIGNIDKNERAIRVSLFRGEREVCSNSLIGGYVLFEDIEFDHYSLRFYLDKRLMGKYLFEIKESSSG